MSDSPLTDSLPSGWLQESEAALLAEIASTTPGDLVEVGAYHGRSTVLLARHMPAQCFLWSFDPHARLVGVNGEKYHELDCASWQRNVVTHCDTLQLARIRKMSCSLAEGVRAIRGPVSFVFVDGDHRELPVAEDVAEAFHLLPAGGKLLMHDWNMASVRTGFERAMVQMVPGRLAGSLKEFTKP